MLDKMLMTFLLRNSAIEQTNKKWPAGGQFIKSKKNDLHNFYEGRRNGVYSNNPELVVTMHHLAVYFT